MGVNSRTGYEKQRLEIGHPVTYVKTPLYPTTKQNKWWNWATVIRFRILNGCSYKSSSSNCLCCFCIFMRAGKSPSDGFAALMGAENLLYF